MMPLVLIFLTTVMIHYVRRGRVQSKKALAVNKNLAQHLVSHPEILKQQMESLPNIEFWFCRPYLILVTNIYRLSNNLEISILRINLEKY